MGIGLTPKRGSATDNAEQNVGSNYDQLQHAPHTLKWMGTNERAARPKAWGGCRFRHRVECGAQRRPRHRKTRLPGPRRQEGEREGGGSGVRVRARGAGGMEEQGARAQAGQNVLFLRLLLLFHFSGRVRRRRSGSPARIGNAGLGRDKVMHVRKARRCFAAAVIQ